MLLLHRARCVVCLYVCACVCERERDSVCEKERERVCEKERDGERKREGGREGGTEGWGGEGEGKRARECACRVRKSVLESAHAFPSPPG